MKLSFVIPCYRSETYITDTILEIRQTMAQRPDVAYQIIAVNDGSPDNVIQVLRELSLKWNELIVIDLMMNFGQENARLAGLNYASGDYIVCLDDDGQCPMNQVWRLIEPLQKGYDVSIARYPRKKQSAFKNFGSKINSMMTHWLLKMPKSVEMSNFFAFNSCMRDEIIRYKNPYPFITGLFFRVTQKVVNVEMEERERIQGTTGYTLGKLIGLWLNGLTNFSLKPLRIADGMGVLFALMGFAFGVFTVVRKIINPEMLAGYASMIAAIFFVGGILMLLLGMLGEYVGRIYLCLNQMPQYVVREVIGAEKSEAADSAKIYRK